PPRSSPFPYTTLFRSPDREPVLREFAAVVAPGAFRIGWHERGHEIVLEHRHPAVRNRPLHARIAQVVEVHLFVAVVRAREHGPRSEEHTSELKSRENL